MFKGKNVLVAGGTGFVGANLINRMLSLGANVRATLHRRDAVIADSRIEYVKADLLAMDDCRRVVQDMDYVFLCAANTSGAAVIASTPLVHVTPNIIMNSQMLEAAWFAKVKKFVWLSSNAAYPPSGDRPVREEEMFDGDPYDIYFGVAWMKRYTEILCRLYSEKLKERMATVVVRPSNIYGPYDDFDFATSHMMSATIRKVVERQKPIKVWGTGDDIRDLIYIDDFIDALVLAAEKIGTFDPVNIGYGKGYSIKEILQICLEVDGYDDAVVEYDSSKPSMIPVRLISTEKAESVLGFKARTDLREGIRKTMEWYRAHPCT
ncbi:MAG: NAD-dependent epimerase/dehydratase family protein [Alphaproteobacteria bacterium]|uniref:NAD-dependent epimerase/dehydratase family protein n=1 Tax=Candidatus Nitrobium versatile TaxID=2884831 RepID=A0A953J9F0_9BACT|nr:NAD-dependent epimerase/dehydratase family protein [Candidatus Nitrobium versatile]